ncbi:MAG: DUF362 domain-containing protein [Proteobacteria bacterium]|nr:DUF362 domain-containing protein [Pseudomonadota bacterium]
MKYPFLFLPKKSKAAENYDFDLKNKLGVSVDGNSYVYLAQGKSPELNIQSVIKQLGGIRKIIEPDDIVIIKPNAQWWNQGMTNTDNIKGFIDEILSIHNFTGEIVIAENHQYSEDKSRGWTTDHPNGKYNYYELIDHYHKIGFNRISPYHWHNAGKNIEIREGDAEGNNDYVSHPDEGDGYVWLKEKIFTSGENRECMMSYPIFTSAVTGRRIDLMRGVYENGHFDRSKLKFINFSALNFHSHYCGITASVKNLMGVVDMTCGYQGTAPEGFFNFHFIGEESKLYLLGLRVNYYLRRLKRNNMQFIGNYIKQLGYFNFYYTGGALGYWLKHICCPDLNIISAEWVGWGSRTDLTKRHHAKMVLASTDPVALDYIAARDVLLPAAVENTNDSNLLKLLNPELKEGPFFKFLYETYKQGVGNIDPNKIKVIVSREALFIPKGH